METTLTLRNRLGFNEVTLWKQFCSRRLHLIHTLSLSLRKASEQEEQVRVLAAELCAEYGFEPTAQADFEKLLIAGIQSVRRNQKRSARNPNGNFAPVVEQYAVRTDVSSPRNGRSPQQKSSDSVRKSQAKHSPQSATEKPQSSPTDQTQPYASHSGSTQYNYAPVHAQQLPHPSTPGEHIVPVLPSLHDMHNPLAHHGPIYNVTQSRPVSDETHVHQSLTARLDVLRSMVGAGSAMWIESHAPEIAHLSAQGVLSTAVATAAVHAKLSFSETEYMRRCITEGGLLEALKHAIDPNMPTSRLMERIGALGASLVHGPHLLSALQALCVCIAQATNGVPEAMCKMLAPSIFDGTTSQYLPRNPGLDAMSPVSCTANKKVSESSLFDPHGSSVSSNSPYTHQSSSATSISEPTSAKNSSVDHPRFTQYSSTAFPAYELRPAPMLAAMPPAPQKPKDRSDLSSFAITSSAAPRPPPLPVQLPLQLIEPNGECHPGVGIQFNVPDRLVTLEYNGKILEMTYSPMKSAPPTLSEIIDNGRSMFSIPPSTVARVKDLQTKKIIESDAELIDAFTQQKVNLELFLPPPMLVGIPPPPKKAKFTPLAPIFQTSS